MALSSRVRGNLRNCTQSIVLSGGRNVVGAYALLPNINKTRAPYSELLAGIQRVTSTLGALEQMYPQTPRIGCISRLTCTYIHDLSLQQTYLNDQAFRTNIRMISSLSFVAIQDTLAAFNTLWNH